MNSPAQFRMLWVYQMVRVPLGSGLSTKMEAGQVPSLCFKGRKHMFCISAGHPVRVLKRDARDFDKLRVVRQGDGDYSITRAVESFRDIAKRHGITAGAKAILERAENAQLGVEDLEDSLTNEEDMQMETPPDAAAGTTAETEETKPTTAKKKAKAKKETATMATKKKSAAPKKAKTTKAPKGPSRISKAVEYMKEQVKKEGGQKALERGWRKELFQRTAEKFDLKASTCGIQYNRQVLNKGAA